MRNIIRLTEGDLNRIVENAVNRILTETDAAGAMQDGGTNPDAGQYTTPFAPVQRRGFMNGVMDRKGGKNKSISMNRKEYGDE